MLGSCPFEHSGKIPGNSLVGVSGLLGNSPVGVSKPHLSTVLGTKVIERVDRPLGWVAGLKRGLPKHCPQ